MDCSVIGEESIVLFKITTLQGLFHFREVSVPDRTMKVLRYSERGDLQKAKYLLVRVGQGIDCWKFSIKRVWRLCDHNGKR